MATGGAAVILHATAFNVQAGFYQRPFYDDKRDERYIIKAGTRLVIRSTAPADALTMNGTVKYQELPLHRS